MSAVRITLEISGHGLGHLAQCAPVVATLAERRPDVEIDVHTAIPSAVVRERLPGAARIISRVTDVNLAMSDAVTVLPLESHAAYVDFHTDWDRRVAVRAAALRESGTTLVVSDVSYLGLAAATSAGIESIAMSSLDWGSIYRRYCLGLPGSALISAQIRAAYASAQCFVRLTPGIAPLDARRVIPVGPIGRRGHAHRDALRRRLGWRQETRVVLLALGGIPTEVALERWPSHPGVGWVLPNAPTAGRDDLAALADTGLAFSDVLASCDAVVTKPGYGTLVEAVAAGIPVICSRRPDWPEEPGLSAWTAARVPVAYVAWPSLLAGALGSALDEVLRRPRPAPLAMDGAPAAARIIEAALPRP